MAKRKLRAAEEARLQKRPPAKQEIERVKLGKPCGHCKLSKVGQCRRCRDVGRYLWSKHQNQYLLAI